MTSVLDTRSVPPAERRDYWSAGIAERFFPMHVESVGAPSFEARLASGQVGPVRVQSIQGLAHRVARTQRMIAAADPECILLYLMTRGTIHIEQDDRNCALRPGDIACQDTSRPSTFEGRDGFEVLVFSIPKWFIGAQAEGIARRSATRVDSGQGGSLGRQPRSSRSSHEPQRAAADSRALTGKALHRCCCPCFAACTARRRFPIRAPALRHCSLGCSGM